MPTEGVVYIAYGDKALSELTYCVNSLSASNPQLAVAVATDDYHKIPLLYPGVYRIAMLMDRSLSNAQKARCSKANLYWVSPFDYTLYMDVDTRVYGDLAPIFGILRDGGELVITPADGQHGDNWLWHVSQPEREATAEQLGFYAQILQGGVIGFRKTPAVKAFFRAWQACWLEYKGEDQAALVRALHTAPVRMWLLGKPYANGAVIRHLFGRTREETK